VIHASLHMRVREGNGPRFEQAWRQIARAVQNMPGNLRQALLRDSSDPRSYVIASDWDSPESFHRFEVSPEQDRLTAPLRELRESARKEVYEIVDQTENELEGRDRWVSE
jgi:heme-degrading monooxygenase HmoA